jgi:hypothetical protein
MANAKTQGYSPYYQLSSLSRPIYFAFGSLELWFCPDHRASTLRHSSSERAHSFRFWYTLILFLESSHDCHNCLRLSISVPGVGVVRCVMSPKFRSTAIVVDYDGSRNIPQVQMRFGRLEINKI